MNIFVLDQTPRGSAKHQCDKHVVKMVLETAQILCSVFYHNSTLENIPYRLTHANHPCCIWARESRGNFDWLIEHFASLLNEYTLRYKKIHKCNDIYQWIINNYTKLTFEKEEITAFAQAMPDKYRNTDAVEAYRDYYNGEKLGIAKWRHSKKPDWIQG